MVVLWSPSRWACMGLNFWRDKAYSRPGMRKRLPPPCFLSCKTRVCFRKQPTKPSSHASAFTQIVPTAHCLILWKKFDRFFVSISAEKGLNCNHDKKAWLHPD